MAIAFEGVSKSFVTGKNSISVLENIDLDIAAGQFLCLFGPSGCGKTTLLNLLAGLETPTQGRVTIDGVPLAQSGKQAILMFQESTLFPWFSVEENVAFGLAARRVPKPVQVEVVKEYLELVGLYGFRKAKVHELSGGMKQRVALARALCLHPDILLMDEPFAALDALTRDSLHEELQRIWLKTGATIVFVTHNVREALILGDKVAVMAPRPGRITRVFSIDLPRPRHFEDAGIVEHAREVLAEMKAGAS
jgi:NitT/TauT family transport system ATP-binding protein